MPDSLSYRRASEMPVREQIVEDTYATNAANDRGGEGGQSDGGQFAANPSRDRSGQFTSNAGRRQQPQQRQMADEQPTQPQPQENPQMHNSPTVIATPAVSPFGFGYPGYGAYPYAAPALPAGGAPVTTVVTGAGGHEHGHNKDALLGIAVDGIRESASAQRSNADGQFSIHREINQLAISGKDSTIAALHDGAEAERRMSSDVRRVENRLESKLDAVLAQQANFRVEALQAQVADLKDARRNDQLEDLLRRIAKKMDA